MILAMPVGSMPTVMLPKLICLRVKSREMRIMSPGAFSQSTEKILVFIFFT